MVWQSKMVKCYWPAHAQRADQDLQGNKDLGDEPGLDRQSDFFFQPGEQECRRTGITDEGAERFLKEWARGILFPVAPSPALTLKE
jgi:hypothetical protein